MFRQLSLRYGMHGSWIPRPYQGLGMTQLLNLSVTVRQVYNPQNPYFVIKAARRERVSNPPLRWPADVDVFDSPPGRTVLKRTIWFSIRLTMTRPEFAILQHQSGSLIAIRVAPTMKWLPASTANRWLAGV
jgi:hypothetical protein